MRDGQVRRERLTHALREVLSELLLTEIKDPRLAGVVISAVELSGDLKLARAYFSVFGDDERVRQAADGLAQARGFLRHECGARMRLHNPPELEFRRDLGFERADRIARVLDEIHGHRAPDGTEAGPVAGGRWPAETNDPGPGAATRESNGTDEGDGDE